MPLVDIHLHLDGSISPAIARRLMELGQGWDAELALPDDALWGRLSVGDGCDDLKEYLEKFDLPAALLVSAAQLEACARMLTSELAALDVAYAELRFAPQRHLSRGLTQAEAVEAALAGIEAGAIESRLILCMMRGPDTLEANRETLRLAAEYLGRGVGGLDLAGAEALFPTGDYAGLLAEARELGVPITVHAGEAAGPESVRAALEAGALRIGHGVRAAEDPALLEELAARGVTLEVCPTSNLNTSVFGRYEDVPLRALMDAGVRVCLGSDNMAVSRTNVAAEVRAMSAAHALTEAEVRRLQLNAVDAAFVDEETRGRIRALVA